MIVLNAIQFSWKLIGDRCIADTRDVCDQSYRSLGEPSPSCATKEAWEPGVAILRDT